MAVFHGVGAAGAALHARAGEACAARQILHGLGAHGHQLVAPKGQAAGAIGAGGRGKVDAARAHKGAVAVQVGIAHRPHARGRGQFGHEVGGFFHGRRGARDEGGGRGVAAQGQRHALAVGGHGDALWHGKFGGKGLVGAGHFKAGQGVLSQVAACQGRCGGRGCHGHGSHRGGLGGGLRDVQRPRAGQAALGGAAGLAGREGELHVAPVLATVLRHQGLAFQQHAGFGGVERGAVGGLPAGAAHLVRQAQLGFAVGGQRHGDGDHLRALAGGAFALGRQRLQRQLQCLLLALQLVRAGLRFVRRLAQRVGGGGDLCGRGGLQAAARRFSASSPGRYVLQVAIDQLQRGGFGLHGGDLVFQLADAAIQRAGAGGHHVAVFGAHIEFAHAHGGVGVDLQALRIERRRQAAQRDAARTGGHLGHAFDRGAAGVHGDAGNPRSHWRGSVLRQGRAGGSHPGSGQRNGGGGGKRAQGWLHGGAPVAQRRACGVLGWANPSSERARRCPSLRLVYVGLRRPSSPRAIVRSLIKQIQGR